MDDASQVNTMKKLEPDYVEYSEDPYENLAIGIVKQAAHDYKDMFKRKLYGFPMEYEDNDLLKETVEFFHSQWYQALTNVDPNYIIDKIEEDEIEKKENLTDNEKKEIEHRVEKAWEKKRRRDNYYSKGA